VVAAALSAPPSSPLERAVADLFHHYYELLDQGYAYRYYAPEPPPTPVVEAHLHFGDGRSDRVVRLPDRSLKPRLRYQRQLALANHLFVEYSQAKESASAEHTPHDGLWAGSYARHLGVAHGCSAVTLYVKLHTIPDPAQVRTLRGGPSHFDLDAEELYTVPERIGDFPCDAL
jgi:hypothetical protein